jgi:hypothetical protein
MLGSQATLEPKSSISPIAPLLGPLAWSSGSASRHTSSSIPMAFPSATRQEENPRHWSFTAFEWLVRDVQKLKDFVEGREAVGDEAEDMQTLGIHDFEVLKESPMLGDGKFKLEIGTCTSLTCQAYHE